MSHLSESPAIGYFLSVFPIVPPAAVSPTDAIVVGIYLLVTIAIGFWVGRGQKDLSDYLLGDRNLPWWAVLGSVVATETSTATVLSVPGWAYAAEGDMRGLQLVFGYIVGRILVAMILLPQYFRGQLFTSYDVLNRRFGGPTKTTASILFLLTRTAGDGLRLYLAALVLAKFVGMPLPAAIGVMGLVTIIYTVFGGMRSVVWNDCMQLVVYLAGGIVALAVIVGQLPGGWQGLIDFGRETGRLQVFDFSLSLEDPFTFWAGLIGGAFLTLGTHGTDQLTVQRLLSSRSEKDASRALILSGFVVLLQFVLFLTIGIGLAAFYAASPPATPIAASDEAFATFIVEDMPSGLCGLMLAAVFAAAMSTLSSSLNSSAASAVNDLIAPQLTDRSERRLLTLGRVLTVLFGIAQIGVALAAKDLIAAVASRGGNVVESVLAIAAFTTGIILGVFGLGVLTKRVTQPAALIGFLAGAAATIAVRLGGESMDFKLAWPWYAFVGAAATFMVGYAASFITPQGERQV
jgi:SSS family transporter